MSHANAVRQSGFGSLPDKPAVDLATVRMGSSAPNISIGPVEAGVPMPSQFVARQPGAITSAALNLKPGESFTVSGAKMSQIYSACGAARKKVPGTSYTARADGDAIRIWRRS
jgi:hypothetical protein